MQFMMPLSRYRMKLFQERSKSVAEKQIVLFGKEDALDRYIEYLLLEVVREIRTVADSLTIFFCGHGYCCRIYAGLLDDESHVGTRKSMMVSKFAMSYDVVRAAEVVPERLVIGYAGEEDQFLRIDISHVSFREYRHCCVVSNGSEEYVLL